MRSNTPKTRVLAAISAAAVFAVGCASDDAALPDDGGETEVVDEPTEEETTEQDATEQETTDGDDFFQQGAEARGIYLVSEFFEEFPEHRELQDTLLEATQAEAVATTAEVGTPIEIALFIPSLEVSDAWARLEGALIGRLDDLGIPHNITHFLTTPDAHSEQAGQVETALANPDQFDYAVFAPTEWEAQKDVVRRLSEAMPTLAYNVANPFYDLWETDGSPLTHIAFDHETGALMMCDWVVEETGGEGEVALVRGVAGFVDTLRSQAFANCIEEKSNLEVVTEVFADFDREQGFTGTNTILTAHPDLTMVHTASTAMALGAIAAMRERAVLDDVLVNGWGGGSDELAELIAGNMDATVFRVIDDWGASGAEIIKLHLEGREDEIPGVVSPTMMVMDSTWTEEEIEAETDFAFRYSGDIDR